MKAVFTTLFLTSASMLAASDPTLLGLVMPDAKIVTGIQVSRSQASPFGQYILSQMKPGANFDKLAAAIGFDPRRDLQEIVAATSSVNTGDPANQQGLILGRGTFQPARIATAAQLGGATPTTYKGFEILGNIEANKTGAGKGGGIVFLDANTVALGDLATLKAVIDRRIAGIVFSGPVADEAKEVSAANDAWFVSSAPSAFVSGKLPGTGPNGGGGFNPAGLLQSVIQTGGGARFTATGVTLSAEALTDSNQNAQALADLLRFGLSLIQMNRNNNPGAGKVASIADAATFAASGPLMRVTLTLPEQQVEQLLMPATAAAQKKVAAR